MSNALNYCSLAFFRFFAKETKFLFSIYSLQRIYLFVFLIIYPERNKLLLMSNEFIIYFKIEFIKLIINNVKVIWSSFELVFFGESPLACQRRSQLISYLCYFSRVGLLITFQPLSIYLRDSQSVVHQWYITLYQVVHRDVHNESVIFSSYKMCYWSIEKLINE